MDLYRKIHDISIILGKESAVWPGDTPYSRESEIVAEKGDTWQIASLQMSSHSGTHIDLPKHLFHDRKALHEYPASSFILPAHVVESFDAVSVKPDILTGVPVQPGDAVLFKTENSRIGLVSGGEFTRRYVYIEQETALLCTGKKAALLGTDYMSVDKGDVDENPVHTLLMENDILILENINLEAVAPGKYTLVCLPLRLYDGEASPVRAVLLEE